MKTNNPYRILGIKKSATEEEIKLAYKKKAHKHHPDKGGNQDDFQKITNAYELLMDPVKRAHYDKHGTILDDNRTHRVHRIISKIFNIGDADSVKSPWERLLQLIDAMKLGITRLNDKIKVIKEDHKVLSASDEAGNVVDVIGMLEMALQQLNAELVNVKEDLVIAKELEVQYALATKILGREPDKQYLVYMTTGTTELKFNTSSF